MIDLTQSTTGTPEVHTVTRDPGNAWTRTEVAAIDAVPDEHAAPPPDPRTRWPRDAMRSGICGSVSPRVIRLPDRSYRMYYTQILPRSGHPAGANDYENATTRILSAVSTDGLSWTPEPGVRLTPEQGNAGEFRVVSSEVVPMTDGSGRLRMYFESCPGTQSTENSIRSALSEDGGLTWTLEEGHRLRISGGNVMASRIIYTDDGRVRLYVTQRDVGIVSAISTDGGTDFDVEGPRLPEDPTAFAPEIIRLPEGGYRMYYTSQVSETVPTEGGSQQILSATSPDGLDWRADGSAIAPDGNGPDAVKASEMCLFEMPAGSEEGAFGMVYEGCDGTTPNARGVWRIARAFAR